MNKINTLVKQLAEVVEERKELEVKEKALKDAVISELNVLGKDSEETPYGKASIARRPSYTYTDAVSALKSKVADREEFERVEGLATEKVTEYLSLRKINN